MQKVSEIVITIYATIFYVLTSQFKSLIPFSKIISQKLKINLLVIESIIFGFMFYIFFRIGYSIFGLKFGHEAFSVGARTRDRAGMTELRSRRAAFKQRREAEIAAAAAKNPTINAACAASVDAVLKAATVNNSVGREAFSVGARTRDRAGMTELRSRRAAFKKRREAEIAAAAAKNPTINAACAASVDAVLKAATVNNVSSNSIIQSKVRNLGLFR